MQDGENILVLPNGESSLGKTDGKKKRKTPGWNYGFIHQYRWEKEKSCCFNYRDSGQEGDGCFQTVKKRGRG